MLEQDIKKINAYLDKNYQGSCRHIKDKLFIDVFGIELYNTINHTIGWVEAPFSHKVRCFISGIYQQPTCKICNAPVRFKTASSTYQTYCSKKCMFIDNEAIQQKKRETNMLRYGSTNVLTSEHGVAKSKQTLLRNYSVDNYLKTNQAMELRKTLKKDYSMAKRQAWNAFYDKLPLLIPNLEIMFSKEEYHGQKKEYGGESNFYKFKCRKCSLVFNSIIEHALHRDHIVNCPGCKSKYTSIEEDIKDFLQQNNINFLFRKKHILKNRELDFYLPDHKIAIEVNGLFWHSDRNPRIHRTYHLDKLNACLIESVRLIHIFSDEIQFRRDALFNRLKSIIGLNKNILHARQCIVKHITKEIKKEFLNQYHLQGNDNSSIHLGLFHNDNLVSIMTFGQQRVALGTKNAQTNVFEMYRYCSKTEYSVNGGASKLFSAFVKEYNPVKIVSYCDRRYSEGNLYLKLGFNNISNTQPNYWYTKDFFTRLHRFGFAKHLLKEKLEKFDPELSERDNMFNNGFARIYDCGSKKFEWFSPALSTSSEQRDIQCIPVQ